MKSIIDKLEEEKLKSITAINEMEKAEAEFERISDLAIQEDSSDMTALMWEWVETRKDMENAIIKARKQVIDYANFIGIKIKKEHIKYDFDIKKKFYEIEGYANEMAKQITKVRDEYMEWHF